MYRKQVSWPQGENYEVTSYGNGAAYSIKRKADGASLFLDGDDADEFRIAYEEDVHGDFGRLLDDLGLNDHFKRED